MTHSCARPQVSRQRREDPCQLVAVPAPTHEEIARLAHRYWEEGGRREGTAAADWRRAERDLARR
jgi:hypothetical protein